MQGSAKAWLEESSQRAPTEASARGALMPWRPRASDAVCLSGGSFRLRRHPAARAAGWPWRPPASWPTAASTKLREPVHRRAVLGAPVRRTAQDQRRWAAVAVSCFCCPRHGMGDDTCCLRGARERRPSPGGCELRGPHGRRHLPTGGERRLSPGGANSVGSKGNE